MKLGRTLPEVAAEIERQRTAKVDLVVDPRALSMDPRDSSLVVPEYGALAVNDYAHRQIGERLGIPAKYYDRLRANDPALLAANVNRWLGSETERRLVRSLDGRVRAYLSDKYQRIDHHAVADVVLPILAEVPEIEVVSTEITERRFYLKAVTHAVRETVRSRRVGDFVEAGIVISNSEIGAGALNVSPFANFLACTNGMIRPKAGMRAYHIGRRADVEDADYVVLSDETKRLEDAATLSRVRDTVRLALDAAKFREWVSKIEETTIQPIAGDPVRAIEVLGNSVGFSPDERTSILRHLIAGADLSRYGLVNAVTRTAEDVASYDRATEIETIGGALVELAPNEWREIALAR